MTIGGRAREAFNEIREKQGEAKIESWPHKGGRRVCVAARQPTPLAFSFTGTIYFFAYALSVHLNY